MAARYYKYKPDIAELNCEIRKSDVLTKDELYGFLDISYVIGYINLINDKYILDKIVPLCDLEEWEDEEFCFKAVNCNPHALAHVKNQTEELCMQAASSYPDIIQYIRNLTYEFCLRVVSKYSVRINLLPKEYLTYELCLASIKTSNNVRFIPLELLTEELCLTACKTHACNIMFIPPSKQTYEIAELVLENKDFDLLKHIFVDLLDYNLCLRAVRNMVLNLKHTPDKFKTYDMCLQAVKKAGVLRYVLDKFIDYNMCIESVKGDPLNIEYIPDCFQTEELCWQAVKKQPSVIRYVKNQTEELCLLAIADYKDNYLHCDKKFTNVYSFNLAAVKLNHRIIRWIPAKFQTTELCQIVIEKDPYLLNSIVQTEELY